MFAINIKKLILNKNYNLTSIIYIYNIYMNSEQKEPEQKEPEQIIPVPNEFELRNLVDKNGIPSQTINLDSINNLSLNNNTEPIAQNSLTQDQMFNMMPNINDNIRFNILAGIEIYKKIKNFDYKYVHEVIQKKL